MSTIYLRLAGGLGNQLFQLLAAHQLHERTGYQVVVLTDSLSSYKTERNPECAKFLTEHHERLFEFRPGNWRNPLEWLSLSTRAGRWAPRISVNDRNFHEHAKCHLSGVSHPLLMDGYFQSGWTTESFAKALQKSRFALPVQEQQKLKPYQCVVHIRGGDFLNVKIHQVTDAHYYCLAISHALNSGYTEFITVSDDREYCEAIMQQIRSRLKDVNIITAAQGGSLIEDFSRIAIAPARILGNSTFSWWAAALGESNSRTWSPLPFTTRRDRDFSLPNETLLSPTPDGSWHDLGLAVQAVQQR